MSFYLQEINLLYPDGNTVFTYDTILFLEIQIKSTVYRLGIVGLIATRNIKPQMIKALIYTSYIFSGFG
ncbi:MAG: hypothetical protein DCF19_11690 [Pseudanabaena frigida]|uniref:Uncharacterized protein n=1 Tax=Pseudanabaena frigida TaxID=945775 RepID=A0A2W4W603_9CYAN|nr:MAG: hypothetical protein DCF19_11690 [Pseudanabaena frigida]